MKNLAIIPARSGSKGLIDKNIKILNGIPLLAHSIISAKESGIFSDIMVSTDSDYYAEIAIHWGADVPFLRSQTTSTDSASTWDVVTEVLLQYEALGKKFDTVTVLQPTSPLRSKEDIIEAYNIMKDKDANFVVSITEMDHSPLWSNTVPDSMSMENFLDKTLINLPRQQIPTYYRINGAIYIVNVHHLKNAKNLYDKKSYAMIMKKENSVDIDDQIDFLLAEVIFSMKS